jgi:hypothetical protein
MRLSPPKYNPNHKKYFFIISILKTRILRTLSNNENTNAHFNNNQNINNMNMNNVNI